MEEYPSSPIGDEREEKQAQRPGDDHNRGTTAKPPSGDARHARDGTRQGISLSGGRQERTE